MLLILYFTFWNATAIERLICSKWKMKISFQHSQRTKKLRPFENWTKKANFQLNTEWGEKWSSSCWTEWGHAPDFKNGVDLTRGRTTDFRHSPTERLFRRNEATLFEHTNHHHVQMELAWTSISMLQETMKKMSNFRSLSWRINFT